MRNYAEQMPSNRICPIFKVSAVKNQGLGELIRFLSVIKNRDSINPMLRPPSAPLEFDINDHFNVQGVGICVSGVITAG